jgi:hypothetical protein
MKDKIQNKTKLLTNKQKKKIKSRKELLNKIQQFSRMLTNTLVHLFPDSLFLEGMTLCKRITHHLIHKGPEWTIRYLKATQSAVEKIIFNLDGNQEYAGISIGLDSNG